ncbi:LacI family transcriptional regulator [Pedobacter frigiditerrae]|uniref:LacI family transcriptional regulator n=1 Tax=Pedobacter frigiditerrae TaxID=2530452 RepID=A0A4R0MUG5_9SPHI|nr:LacI family DNA-binding transcriptional regulator [Pedobacter frigiditerrae]TCC90387.1 LacI family transcriptional regulator [Pedobacter frigiditerrae]
MNTNITLRDIAKALNLSISTVSRALTDSYQIGEKTKQEVLAYAKEHHYVPNRMARGLKEGKSRSIGVVVCSIDNNFMAQMLDGIDQYCSEHDYQLIMMQSKELFEQEKANVNLLYAGGIDGLLICPSYQTTDFSYLINLQESGLPVVLFDRLSNHIDTHKVAVDNFKGAYEATQHLINNGYHAIAHLNWNTQLSTATERFEGYKKALKDAGIPFNNDWVKFCDTSNAATLDEELETAIGELMALKQVPRAIFTATDLLSTKCLEILRKCGHRIPEDIALVGFSNTDLAEVLNPSLSTIRQPSLEIGRLAAKQLLSLISDRRATEHFETILLPTELQVRASSQKSK